MEVVASFAIYLELSLDFVPVVLEGGRPLHRLVLGLQRTLLLPQDLLVGLLQGLSKQTRISPVQN